MKEELEFARKERLAGLNIKHFPELSGDEGY